MFTAAMTRVGGSNLGIVALSGQAVNRNGLDSLGLVRRPEIPATEENMKRQSLGTLLTTVVLCATVGAAQVTTSHHAGSRVRPKPTAPASADFIQYKGIFEPVNYGQDIDLTDVFFVSPDVGWVSGEHATILKTTDGGKTWKAQIGGDPNGPEKPIGQLRFLDARHGWAVTDDSPQRLLRTVDSENWEQVGQGLAPGSGFVDYAFTSVRHGVALGGNMGGFYVTNDGGRHWQHVGPCQITVRIQGLPQKQDCYPLKVQMLSASSGLAITSWRSPEAPNSTSLAVFRTDNGGQSWTYVVPTFHEGGDLDIFFTDLDHGVAVFNNDKTYVTADGGRNWHTLLSGAADTNTSRVRFADPETGWSVGEKYPGLELSYTTDGGQHWKSFAPLRLPGDPDAKNLSLSFPRRDRAYIAGPHGMVYRYRIVPATYTATNAFDGPMMSRVDDAQINAGIHRIHNDIVALQSKLNPALVAAGLPPVEATPSAASGSASSTDASTAAAPNDGAAGSADTDTASATASIAASSSGSTDVSSPGSAPTLATTSETSADSSATVSADSAAASGTMIDAGAAASTNVSGDPTQPATQALQNCCAAQVQQLQSDVSSFQQQVPAFTSKYRTLNLIVAGIRVAQDMIGKAEAFKTTLVAFKKAPNLQSAAAVLQDFIGKYDSTRQEFASGFNNPTPLADAESGTASTTVAATPDTGALVSPATDATIPGTAAGTPLPPAQSQGDQSQSAQTTNATVTQSADQAVQKVEDKIKKKIPKWPH